MIASITSLAIKPDTMPTSPIMKGLSEVSSFEEDNSSRPVFARTYPPMATTKPIRGMKR
jgi:hypothetical protein